MIPLSMADAGEKKVIIKVTGKDETRKFLENLGFVEGTEVMIISEIAGNLIVKVRDSRVAVDRSMANRIMV